NVRTQSNSEGVKLTYDDNSPTAVIQDPNQPFERLLTVITGSASDVDTPITGVDIAISTGASYPYEDFYWNGTGWQGTARWLPASGTFGSANVNWSFTGSTPTWINNRVYNVHARPMDSAGNNNNIASSTFTFDNTPATAGISYPTASLAVRSLAMV